MKIIAVTALRYGSEYLASAMRSVINHVDEWHILYATQPSHGHWSDAVCPDSEDDLHQIAWQVAGTKLKWHRGGWTQEGQQRDSILQYAPDADAIIIVDSDEIWQERLIETVHVNITHPKPNNPVSRYLRLPFVHFYRNFRHCVVHDPAYPQRVIFPNVASGDAGWNANAGVISHFGYCQSAETIRYKLKIHGHSGQFRCTPDEYVDGIYLDVNRWNDLHPIGSEYWNAEVVKPFDYLPHWMADHENFGKDVVK